MYSAAATTITSTTPVVITGITTLIVASSKHETDCWSTLLMDFRHFTPYRDVAIRD